ncbi:uncharacterized protein LOC662511 isoform X2 [Tribolium castaneum]|uniref:DUF229 domain containing protein n=2 Tax=Tribolium castaneum TaxID=7070 RepID=D6WL82_TRICA|nr:PREDICTED: uncharacterized protein LOC662511 isoform X2 [Tribolium castaneum]XP_008193720.1 PREDICTED: uncharacterized protein LOC662511 isoform X2 [Tribolium castaneum]XP_008193721.1 PREDICTED: uncharacterized protein LOC662511 isoform X2 [Tribolium castaneum]XP_015835874.1 PREDICTED: uncharacterized protein LOC662511 isoform X2 [Tribolium castaneum]EFA03493.1 hypothetical protein TcasGA2_TC013492 [Tribolium castaneum]|eukprot:XP_008193719.1 PREDICTED: uncharacterized protein LOC662511 isoform X2 [Tribolium castaneum]
METKERRWRVPSIFWLPLIIFAALLFVMDVFQTQYTIVPARIQIGEEFGSELKGFLIKTPGCRIPFMDPFDPSITKFIHKEKQPVCNDGIPPLFDSNMTSIFLLNSSVANYTDQDVSAIQCCYQPFYRQEPKGNDGDSSIKFEKRCISFNISAKISHEFIKVMCKVNKVSIYTDFFSFVPIKTLKKNTVERRLNVLVVGIDAVSRLNFHRQMPTTVDYLLRNMSAVELLGYNKVGDNTFPNLIPVLTGLSEKTLEYVCWNDDNKKRFDACPFIWKNFKAKGFVTSFGEDSSWMGIFNYMRKGFWKQPTDYMWGAFNRISENQIGNSHNMNVEECVGAREVYKVFLDYITNFVKTMAQEQLPYFAFYWGASLTHDYLNKPNLGDPNYYNFFKNLHENGHLNSTVLIVMSDHGIRWGDIRQTFQGQMEERLPFVFMVLPDWYKRQYQEAYSNLVKNTRRLTTPYDLHETLKDLLNPFALTHDFLQSRYRNVSRGYSLFNEISPKRTCESAQIASHWCTCQQSIEIERNNSLVVEAANYAVDYMNFQLEGYAQCSNLTLESINDARIMTHEEHITNGNEVKDYMIIIETVPGNGVFEVTLRSTVGGQRANHFEVMGTISRLNLYGKQSACITDFHLKLYCYCKNLLGD